VEKARYKGSEKKCQEMGQGITEYTNLVNGAVWECPMGSPVPSHRSWSTTVSQVRCSDHTRPASPTSATRGLRWERGGVLSWPANKHLDRQIEHPGVTMSVPVLNLMTLAAVHCYLEVNTTTVQSQPYQSTS